jgi:hypothetical protein
LQFAFPVVWKALDRNKEVISENATRNVMSWLRSDGCAPHENEMFEHEWFTMWDSDEEEESEEVTSAASFKHRLKIEEWLTMTTSTTRPSCTSSLEEESACKHHTI